ncbi:uncharacterized protein [Blastocystis hominis]|uniref:Protein kinase domain-containing protein n=1 Tax=Blastocystis hominis TaxID=12968 RepID=D8M4L8_BLAHO|nr:uncharacterized protein [Blastocystis hominis]CBK23007.2 unnamed protein product [Blastocystis hominis]|eukprot:XP_012897055.1 uncharacterized protein [Blastocystis hominis]
MRCIFYEFVMREPIVQCKQGDCEFDVLAKLFRLLGFPGDDCSIFENSPYHGAFNHCKECYPRLRELIPAAPLVGMRYLTNNGVDLMYQLLEFDPKKRISAEDALNHPYFKEMPKMKRPEEMPVFDKV